MRKLTISFLIGFCALQGLAQQPSGGTLVTAPIRPNDLLDLYPTAFANEIKGGHHQVADTVARNNIYLVRREIGMLCTVLDDGSSKPKTYQLIGGTLNSNWVEFSGGGSSNLLGGLGINILNDSINLAYGNGLAIIGNQVITDLGNGLEFNGSAISIDFGTGLNMIGNEITARTTEALWNANQLQSVGISTSIPLNKNILSYDGSVWAPNSVGSLLIGGDGINISNDTIDVDYGNGLTISSNKLVANIGKGLTFNADTIQASLGTGLEFNGSDIRADLGNGLSISGNDIIADIGSGLQFIAGAISVNEGTGLNINLSGEVVARTNEALWNASQLQGVGITTIAPSTGKILMYNGTSWSPSSPVSPLIGGDGINILNDTVSVDYGAGLSISSNKLVANIGNGLAFNGDTIIASLGTGLEFNGSDIRADLGNGLSISGNDIIADIGDGLQFIAGAIYINEGTGLNINLSGEVVARTNEALWNASQLQGVGITTVAPSSGEILTYNGTNWSPSAPLTPLMEGDGINISNDTVLVDYGVGLGISANKLVALVDSSIWNAKQLRSIPISTIAPVIGQNLIFNGASWVPSTPQLYSPGDGISFSSNTISVEYGKGLTISTSQLIPNLGNGLEFNGSLIQADLGDGLEFDGSNIRPRLGNGLEFNGTFFQADLGDGLKFDGSNITNDLGYGLKFNSTSIVVDYGTGLDTALGKLIARNSESLWNANQLQGEQISTIVPTNGQILTYDGSNWTPGTQNSYTAGVAIDLSGNAISVNYGTGLDTSLGQLVARNSESLWNANLLQGEQISTISPTNGQILTYNGTNWTPGSQNAYVAGGGIKITSNTISVEYGNGLKISSNLLMPNLGNGLELNGAIIQADIGQGLEFDGSNIRPLLGNGLEFNGNYIRADLGLGLSFDGSNIQVTESTIEGLIENDINDNYIPYNNATKLVASNIYYDGTNIGIGTISPKNKLSVAGNISIGNVGAGTSANRTLVLENGNLPTTSPANVVQLFAKDYDDSDGTSTSELFVRDEDGNETNLSPHNFSHIEKSELMAWSYYSRNHKLEQAINVDMLRVVRLVEQLTGENLVSIYTFDGMELKSGTKNSESISYKIQKLESENKELREQLEIISAKIELLDNN